MKRLLLLLLLIGTKGFAYPLQKVPLPEEVYDLNQIVKEFRGPFKTKIEQLSKNYITKIKENHIIYMTAEGTSCGYSYAGANSIVSQVQYSYEYKHENNKHLLVEYINYFGCNDRLSLREVVITTSMSKEKLIPLSMKDLIKAKRDFNLKDHEISKTYKVLNGQTEKPVVLLNARRINNGMEANLSITNQLYMNLNYLFKDNMTDFQITFHPIRVIYSHNGGTYRLNKRYGPWSIGVRAFAAPLNEIQFYDREKNLTSSQGYQDWFVDALIEKSDGVLFFIKEFIGMHLNDFPNTEFTQSAAQNSKILNELRLANTRLLTNSSLNLVQNKIQELIEAIEAGKIVIEDQRED